MRHGKHGFCGSGERAGYDGYGGYGGPSYDAFAGFDDAGPAYADAFAEFDDADYYSTRNPRYGQGDRFAPPRSFAREPLRLSDKMKSFACIAAALLIVAFAATGLARAGGLELPFLSDAGRTALGGAGESTADKPLASAALDASGNPAGEDFASTPRDQWQQGSMPHLYQRDPAWSESPYAGSTLGVAGCGPTCLSMVAICLTGDTSLDPVAVAEFAEHNGYVDDGATAWRFMRDGAAQLGLSSEEVGGDAFSVTSALEDGDAVIAILGPGDFTTEGHFIVLYGLDQLGRAGVYDPNSPSRSETPWDVDRIVGQALCFWRLSA